jgi:Tannase and feruloyl esterase
MTLLDNGSRTSGIVLKAAAVAFAATVSFAVPASADSCSNLASTFHRPNTTITLAQTVPAGTFVTPTTPPQSLTGLPQFCRVAGFTTPTTDSHIQFEVWMPESGWILKYLQAGCGGFCGSISYGAMAEPLRRGYAVAATDDGHEASGIDATWAVGHPEKVVDFGYRSLKETTDVAKDLIFAFYMSGPQRSYFMGCSDGGREALMEAQRFPHDFDGIVAGSPANFWTHLFAGFVWDQQALGGISGGDLSQTDLNTMTNAVLAQCVGHNGGLSTDQFLNNPLACHFDPSTLPLSQDKIGAIKKIFSGPPGVFPGYQGGAGEASTFIDWPLWMTDTGNPALALQGLFAANFFQNMVFPGSGWTVNSFSAAENAKQADIKVGAILNSISPDLGAFKSHGGKLIQYVGWSDTAISPQNDIDYYNAVTDVMGGPGSTRDFYRLFMAPGMAHCGGGPGPNAFGNGVNGPNPADPRDDLLSALDNWVVNRAAPDEIVATKYVNDDPTQGVAFQRPLCVFPKVSKYKGGSTTAASSFRCVGQGQNQGNDKLSDNQ